MISPGVTDIVVLATAGVVFERLELRLSPQGDRYRSVWIPERPPTGHDCRVQKAFVESFPYVDEVDQGLQRSSARWENEQRPGSIRRFAITSQIVRLRDSGTPFTSGGRCYCASCCALITRRECDRWGDCNLICLGIRRRRCRQRSIPIGRQQHHSDRHNLAI